MGATDKQMDKLIAARKGKDCLCQDCLNKAIRKLAGRN